MMDREFSCTQEAATPAENHWADPGAWRMSSAMLSTSESLDVDEHAAAHPGWDLQYDQLSGGRFSGRTVHVQLPGMRLVFESVSCGVRQRGRIGEREVWFGLVEEQVGEVLFNAQRVTPNSMMIARDGSRDLASSARCTFVGLAVDIDVLLALWQRLYHKQPGRWMDKPIAVQLTPADAAHLRQDLIRTIEHCCREPGFRGETAQAIELRDRLLFDWVEAIPRGFDASILKSVEARKRVVERACDFIMARRDQALSIPEVSNRVGASPRKLEYCFRDVIGMSPQKYLRAIRLNGVRRDLKREGCTASGVGEAASRWGFWHLSAFAGDYKKQFNELPSETLRRARATV
jgi:AraC family ethanolamine operon transcriptional activator